MPQREIDRRNGDRSEPLHTPAMAGGLFSIDRYKPGAAKLGMECLAAVAEHFLAHGRASALPVVLFFKHAFKGSETCSNAC